MVEVEPFYADLGRHVRWHRERKHITQRQLGESLDPPTTRASIANIEAGKQRVLAHTLLQLADALGVTVHDLLPTPKESPVAAIRKELSQKLELPERQLRRVVEKLASAKPGRVK